VLEHIAQQVGLVAPEVRAMLTSIAFEQEVKSSQLEASKLGISGVPFYVFQNRFALSGAQPREVFERALERIRAS
jgi:predicted DsbA family dithiol-disulfide isomerase